MKSTNYQQKDLEEKRKNNFVPVFEFVPVLVPVKKWKGNALNPFYNIVLWQFRSLVPKKTAQLRENFHSTQKLVIYRYISKIISVYKKEREQGNNIAIKLYIQTNKTVPVLKN